MKPGRVYHAEMSPTVPVSQNTTREDYNISCYITLVIKNAYDKGRLGFTGRGGGEGSGDGEVGGGERGEGKEVGGWERRGGREGNRNFANSVVLLLSMVTFFDDCRNFEFINRKH